jgi:hypothetical protein
MNKYPVNRRSNNIDDGEEHATLYSSRRMMASREARYFEALMKPHELVYDAQQHVGRGHPVRSSFKLLLITPCNLSIRPSKQPTAYTTTPPSDDDVPQSHLNIIHHLINSFLHHSNPTFEWVARL